MALTITPGAVTNVLINGQSTGAIGVTNVAGGTGPYAYTWTVSAGATAITAQNGQAKTALKAGTYTVTVTDSASGTATHAYTITQNAVLAYTMAAQTNITVRGAATGALGAITATGGSGTYTAAYTVTNGGTPISATTLTAKTGLLAGTYAVVVSDSVGATTASQTFVLTQPAAPLTISGGEVTREFVQGEWRFSIGAVTLSGGTPAYTYAWTSTGSQVIHSLNAKNNLTRGVYTITVTDSASGTATKVIDISMKGSHKMWKTATGWLDRKPQR